jgi:hypothetical protein
MSAARPFIGRTGSTAYVGEPGGRVVEVVVLVVDTTMLVLVGRVGFEVATTAWESSALANSRGAPQAD